MLIKQRSRDCCIPSNITIRTTFPPMTFLLFQSTFTRQSLFQASNLFLKFSEQGILWIFINLRLVLNILGSVCISEHRIIGQLLNADVPKHIHDQTTTHICMSVMQFLLPQCGNCFIIIPRGWSYICHHHSLCISTKGVY